jgi:hypothetical protein
MATKDTALRSKTRRSHPRSGQRAWSRGTEAKFYRVQNGRVGKRQRLAGETKAVRARKEDRVVIPNMVPTHRDRGGLGEGSGARLVVLLPRP